MTDTAREQLLAGAPVTADLLDRFETEARAGHVEVKLDPSLRAAKEDPAPQTDDEKSAWPLLDTAYNMIREAAVRVTLNEIRRQSVEQGVDVGTDEELFRQAAASGIPGAPTSYADLAPDHINAATLFYECFTTLFDKAMNDAVSGVNSAVSAASELGLDG